MDRNWCPPQWGCSRGGLTGSFITSQRRQCARYYARPGARARGVDLCRSARCPRAQCRPVFLGRCPFAPDEAHQSLHLIASRSEWRAR